MLAAPLRVPRYDDACLTHLLDDATAALLGHEPRLVPLPADLHAVIVLVIDGLGRRLLDAHPEVAPLLAAAPGTTVDAAFPTTTATNLTSLSTGLTPRAHGFAGTVLGVDGRRFVTLSWSWDRLVGGEDARPVVTPQRQQPLPTRFEAMARDGVRPVTVFRPDHIGSGLTDAIFRGGEVHGASGLDAVLTTAIDAATRGPAPTVVYAHHADVDTAGHLSGPGSARWCEELAGTDAALTRALDRLPAGVALVVTADHGQVRVQDDDLIELTGRPELLAGVRTVAGDPRAPQLHVVDGAADDVAAAWQEQHGGIAEIRTTAQALADGWFGPPGDLPGALDEQIAGRSSRPAVPGDVVVAPHQPVAWVHAELDHRGGHMPGHHGSLTPDELEVPALVLTRRDDR